MSWLSERVISRPAGYVSKTAALKLVEASGSPNEEAPPVEEPVVEKKLKNLKPLWHLKRVVKMAVTIDPRPP